MTRRCDTTAFALRVVGTDEYVGKGVRNFFTRDLSLVKEFSDIHSAVNHASQYQNLQNRFEIVTKFKREVFSLHGESTDKYSHLIEYPDAQETVVVPAQPTGNFVVRTFKKLWIRWKTSPAFVSEVKQVLLGILTYTCVYLWLPLHIPFGAKLVFSISIQVAVVAFVGFYEKARLNEKARLK